MKARRKIKHYKTKREYIDAHTERRAGSDCLWWTGTLDQDGYGIFVFRYQRCRAHREALFLKLGIENSPLWALHSCHNPQCVNPDHLRLGTNEENCADTVKAGRQNSPRGERHGSKTHPERLARGERHGSKTHPESVARGDRSGARTHPERLPRGSNAPWSKLNEEKVLEIRERHAKGEKQKDLAEEFGVTHGAIFGIVHRKNWKHLP